MARSFLIIVLLAISIPLTSADIGDKYQEALTAFEQKNYIKAVQLFEEILESGTNSVDLQYNLGTCYLQINKLGKARLHLEKALLLEPHSKDIQQNLAILKDKIETTVIPLETFFLKKWWIDVSNIFNPSTWAGIAIFIGLCILLTLYFMWFKSENPSLKKVLIFAITSLFIVLSLGISRYNFITNSNTAVVMKSTELKSSVTDDSATNNLSAGVKLTIILEDDEWTKVSTMDLEEGWVKRQDIERI